jgi:hypothetical protein
MPEKPHGYCVVWCLVQVLRRCVVFVFQRQLGVQ